MSNNEIQTVNRIREQYAEKTKEKSAFDELLELDKKAKLPAIIFAFTFGIIGALVLGLGMCLAMEVIGNSMILGIAIGIVGIVMVSVNYTIYSAIISARKKKYAPRILEISDSITNS